ncbi:MAG: phosphomannose isomerase type II C-terminal cupin domain [Candidatus Caenarcaniphilales bacterium]|nr:phosphomannose isomerase type II C-terminal cupin domain [Candidatus Caenarcaniphilales bacterium]
MLDTQKTNITPWGSWQVLDDSEDFKVKKIKIKSGQRLSYQKHFKREENWFIVNGQALVTLDDEEQELGPGDYIHIPFQAKHRIANISSTEELVFIEIQKGTYFGEDDIVRFADDYGRS